MEWEEQLRSVALPLLRFGVFTSHGILFGLVPILFLVLRPAFAGLGPEWDRGRRRLSERLEGIVVASLLASGIATALVLLLQTALLSGLGTGELEGDSFLSVLETSFGQVVALRIPLLVALGVMLVGRVRRWALPQPDHRAPKLWWLLWIGASFGLFATSTFSGHSTVASPVRLAEANDILHQVFSAIWFAGIVLLAALLPDAWIGKDRLDRLDLLEPAVSRFSRVAMVSIAIVAVTGTLNSFLHIGAPNDLWDTGYGRTLGLKILLFFGILALGGVNHYFVKARLASARRDREPSDAQGLFRKTIAAELAIAIAIMASTGLLVGLARTREIEAPATESTAVVED